MASFWSLVSLVVLPLDRIVAKGSHAVRMAIYSTNLKSVIYLHDIFRYRLEIVLSRFTWPTNPQACSRYSRCSVVFISKQLSSRLTILSLLTIRWLPFFSPPISFLITLESFTFCGFLLSLIAFFKLARWRAFFLYIPGLENRTTPLFPKV